MKNISIVTGGSSGLGKAIAKKLVDLGQNVCLVARDEKKLAAAAKEIGKNVVWYSCDIANEANVEAVYGNLIKSGYNIEYLFNCAGKGYFGRAENMHQDKIVDIINSNVIGLMNMSYAACRTMTDGGTIVNIASSAALKGNAKETLYCASKWAVRGFTEALRAFYKDKKDPEINPKPNIHVIGVYPGGINTPFWSPECGMSPNVGSFMNPEEVAEVIVTTVMKRETMYCADIIIERK